MKTITASLFALVLSAPFALADGCGMHGEQEASMSCATGQACSVGAGKQNPRPMNLRPQH